MTPTPPTRGWNGPPLRQFGRPAVLFGSVFAVGQLFLYESPHLSLAGGLVGAMLVPVVGFGLFLLWARWDRRPLASYGFFRPRPLAVAVGVAGFLVLVQSIVLLEPGLGLGFGSVAPLSAPAFGYTLALAPISALATTAVFEGYVLDRLMVPGRFALALALSSAMYAANATNFSILGMLGPVGAGTYLFTNTVTGFALGIVLGLYFYKSGRNLLGPFVLRTGGLLFAGLFPVVAYTTGWELSFLVALLADGAILFLLVALLREPKLLARAYLGETYGPKKDRFLSTLRRGRRARETVVACLVAAAVLGGTIVGVEVGLGTSHPLLAIATGSMEPVFHRGTLVVIQHVGAAQISVGTIIAYTSTCLPSPVVHRVVAISNASGSPVYTTKGDANPSNDPCPVPYSAVEGKVVLIVPYLGFFVLAPELTVGVAALAVVGGILFWPQHTARIPRRRALG